MNLHGQVNLNPLAGTIYLGSNTLQCPYSAQRNFAQYENCMKSFASTVACFAIAASSFAQHVTWSHSITEMEREHVERQGFASIQARGITDPPPFEALRTAAEWEEIEALTISWTSFPCIQKQIVAASMAECSVIVFADDPAACEAYLTGSTCGGSLDLSTVQIVDAAYNSIWIRDYGATTVYGSFNDDRILVDWMYNRPRPLDDVIPDVLGETLNIPVYSTTDSPNDLMGTGGNWMVDGFGTAFASELILDENMGGSTWWTTYPDHSEQEVRDIVTTFHGVNDYVLMPTLPFDGIHHIDMHMKLLDESRLLVAEYPSGMADGPQIEANLEYVLANYTTRWGTPFEVVRIPSPPESGFNGGYPNQGGDYLTYTNSVFVNNTLLVPTYYEQYDTTALRIYEEQLPGYQIVGIDCDNAGEDIIQLSGAIHCITHSVGVEDPLILSHLPLPDTEDTQNDYALSATCSHRTGMAITDLHWRVAGETDWNVVNLTADGEDEFIGAIPAQPENTVVEYYLHGEANSGKTGNRPMPAPEGFWSFRVGAMPQGILEAQEVFAQPAFPNPASAITCIPLQLSRGGRGTLQFLDATGRCASILHAGVFQAGSSKFFLNAANHPPGAYVVQLVLDNGLVSSQRLMIR